MYIKLTLIIPLPSRLGWLEAGPTVWFSENGYIPHMAGKKVSQLQALLARRCAVIDELQQHLWRANWRMLGGRMGECWLVELEESGLPWYVR